MIRFEENVIDNQRVLGASDPETGDLLIITGPSDQNIPFDAQILDAYENATIKIKIDMFCSFERADGFGAKVSFSCEFYHHQSRYEMHVALDIQAPEGADFSTSPNEWVERSNLDIKQIIRQRLAAMIIKGMKK